MKIPACNVPPCAEQPSCTAQQDLCSPQATVYIKGEAGQKMLTGDQAPIGPGRAKPLLCFIASPVLGPTSNFGSTVTFGTCLLMLPVK